MKNWNKNKDRKISKDMKIGLSKGRENDKRKENKNTSTKIKMTLHSIFSSKFSSTLIDYIDRYQH